MINPLTILLQLISFGAIVSASPAYGANRILVVKGDEKVDSFLSSLRVRGFDVQIHDASATLPPLVKNQDLEYDHVAVLSAKVSSFGGSFKAGNLVEFVNRGGNVLLVADTDYTDPIAEFAVEFGVIFESRKSSVIDYFHQVGNNTNLVSVKALAPSAKHVLSLEKKSPLFYSGVGHRLSGRNPLTFSVVTGEATTLSKVSEKVSAVKGTSLSLVSAFQSRNNSRVVFCGGLSLFKDDAAGESSNAYAAEELSKWAFQEKSVLRLIDATHHKVNETERRGIYRIKDDISITFKIQQWTGKKWEAFKATDVQVEAVMLDPYVRLNASFLSGSTGAYESRFTLPDQYGVFTLKTQYTRHGLTFVEYSDTVQVRPFRHDQYPRFLTVALPYYVNLFSMMGGFFALSVLFLYNRDTGAVGKAKVKTN